MGDRITIDIDPDNAGNSSGDPIPAGDWEGVIDNVEVGASKSSANSGKPVYNVKVKLEGNGVKGVDGRSAIKTVCLWDGALISYYQLAKAVGQPADTSGNKLEVLTPRELIGKKVRVKIVHETYQDELRHKINRFTAPKAPGTSVAGPGTGARVPFKRPDKPAAPAV
jgi:hypothetical protein